MTTQQIAELPLNGRSFMQLATLQPGVIVSRATAKDFTGGFGNTQLAIGGARPEQTGYLMDGTNIADISDKAPSSLSGVLLGVDTVQEFSVQTHGYSAEFGRAAGGVMSTVTKSGTNRIRGTVFEFHRDEALDARNYFATGDLPDFQRISSAAPPAARSSTTVCSTSAPTRRCASATPSRASPACRTRRRTRASCRKRGADQRRRARHCAAVPAICSIRFPTARTSATAPRSWPTRTRIRPTNISAS